MELYLIRHGIAVERDTSTQDEARPLTDKGRKKTSKVAKHLYKHGLRFDLILTSPLVRTRETAVILEEAGLSAQVEDFEPLAPDGDIQTWANWLEQWRRNSSKQSCLALVGHQPDLGNWSEHLLWGNAQEKIVLKKAGVIGLTLPDTGTPIGQSALFLLISPKWLLG